MIQGAAFWPLGLIEVILTGQCSTFTISPGPLRSWPNSGTLPSYYADLVTCTDTLLTACLGLSVDPIYHMTIVVVAWKLLGASDYLPDFRKKRIEFGRNPLLLMIVSSPRSAPS